MTLPSKRAWAALRNVKAFFLSRFLEIKFNKIESRALKVFLPDRIVRSGHRSEAEYDGKHFVGNQLLPTLRAYDDDDQSGEKIHRLEEELRTCFGRSFNTG